MEDLPETVKFNIFHLVDVPESIAALAEMYVQEWLPYYGPDGPGDASADLFASCNRDDVPLVLVAMNKVGDVIGTGALKSHSLGAELDEGPWLAALVVSPTSRRRGVGTAIMGALIEKARQLGFQSVYISTDASDHLLKNQNWRHLRDTSSMRGSISVFRHDLT